MKRNQRARRESVLGLPMKERAGTAKVNVDEIGSKTTLKLGHFSTCIDDLMYIAVLQCCEEWQAMDGNIAMDVKVREISGAMGSHYFDFVPKFL